MHMTQPIPSMTAARGQPGHLCSGQSLGGALGKVTLVVCPPVILHCGHFNGCL